MNVKCPCCAHEFNTYTAEILENLSPSMEVGNKIFGIVAKYFVLTPKQIRSRRRTNDLVTARQCAMWLMRKYTWLKLWQIGVMLGRDDHTTVIHGIRTVNNLLFRDQPMQRDIAALEQRCQEELKNHPKFKIQTDEYTNDDSGNPKRKGNPAAPGRRKAA